MRGRGRARKQPPPSPRTAEREAVERKWWPRAQRDPRLATKVTSESARHEPFHRWHPYRQSFAPALVREFLDETTSSRAACGDLPVLDPFCGAGTVPVECGRRSVTAMGVDASAALIFLLDAKFARAFPPFPGVGATSRWTDVAEHLVEPVHRAALMLAEGRRYTTAGRPNRGARPLGALLSEVVEMMRVDLVRPIPMVQNVQVGDARSLSEMEDESIGGILTSPPYLSRHDYDAILNPLAAVYRYWHDVDGDEARQLAAHPKSRPQRGMEGPHPAVEESALRLEEQGERRLAGVVRAYFEQMTRVLAACHRVLVPGAPCWMVVGGARWKDVYIPADFVVAEMAEAAGFEVRGIRVARDLIDGRRKFGNLGHVAPRESLLEMESLSE